MPRFDFVDWTFIAVRVLEPSISVSSAPGVGSGIFTADPTVDPKAFVISVSAMSLYHVVISLAIWLIVNCNRPEVTSFF